MSEYIELWNTKGGSLSRVSVRPVQAQGKLVFRDQFGVTYASRFIKEWNELTPDQQSKAYRDSYQAKWEDALWRIAKEPELSSSFEAWKAEAKAVRDNALNAIARGEIVQPPNHVWE